MKKVIIAMLLFCFASPVFSQQERKAETGQEEILKILALEQKAHLTYDAELLVSLQAEDFVSVQSGQISYPTVQDRLNRFSAYFSAVRFVAWEDVVPPRIELSGDGSLAVAAVQKRVLLSDKGAAADAEPEKTIFAWTATYRKMEGQWKMIMIASTRQVVETK